MASSNTNLGSDPNPSIKSLPTRINEENERCEPERMFYNSQEDNRENALSDNISERSFRSVNDGAMTLPNPKRKSESDLVQRFRTNLQLR
jgi:hypothetical protein